MTKTAVRYVTLFAMLALVPLAPELAAADDWEDSNTSHDRARRAVSGGEIIPIEQLISGISRQLPGDIVAVELEREDIGWVYELKILASDGRLHEVYVDAYSGRVVLEGDD
jgi:uncharacterized membrane protein YkoI